MLATLTDMCQELRNWFCDDADKHFGTFEISGGSIAPLDFLQDGQYYRIVGSVFNDGVHKYGDTSDTLADESFNGAIWAMRLPENILSLATEIKQFKAKNGEPTPYTSESFGGYSYTRATDANGVGAGWQTVFASRLNRWRKI